MRLLVLLLMVMPICVFSQDCPKFEVKVIDTNQGNEGYGSIEVSLENWIHNFGTEHFELRQKVNQVSGPLDFEYKTDIKGNKIIFSGLIKSEQLLLKQYVVLFSHKSCQSGELIEVGLFQIK